MVANVFVARFFTLLFVCHYSVGEETSDRYLAINIRQSRSIKALTFYHTLFDALSCCNRRVRSNHHHLWTPISHEQLLICMYLRRCVWLAKKVVERASVLVVLESQHGQ
jgi:hypothetical protein